MAKQIVRIVHSCADCYKKGRSMREARVGYTEFVTLCNETKVVLNDLNMIDKDCPLEDYNE